MTVLRQAITGAVLEDPADYVSNLLPVSWLATCDALKTLGATRAYIPRGAFSGPDAGEVALPQPSAVSAAMTAGVFASPPDTSREDTLTALLLLFHRLGLLLYFDTPALRHTVILDSQWLVNKIVYLIRDIKLHRFERDRVALARLPRQWDLLFNNGILSRALLRVLWGDDEARNEFLLNVLTEIGLLCELPSAGDADGAYFIPASVVYAECPPATVEELVCPQREAMWTVGAGDSGSPAPDTAPWSAGSILDAPLSLMFVDQFVPVGFLDRLLVLLVRGSADLYCWADALSLVSQSDDGGYCSELLLSTREDGEAGNGTAVFSATLFSSHSGVVCLRCGREYLARAHILLQRAADTVVKQFIQGVPSFEVHSNSAFWDNCADEDANVGAAAAATGGGGDSGVRGSDVDGGRVLVDEDWALCGPSAAEEAATVRAVSMFVALLSPRASEFERGAVCVDSYARCLVEAGFTGDGAVSCLWGTLCSCGRDGFLHFLGEIGVESVCDRTVVVQVLQARGDAEAEAEAAQMAAARLAGGYQSGPRRRSPQSPGPDRTALRCARAPPGT